MAKFCPSCGASCEDSATLCPVCSSQFVPADTSAAPQQPVYQAPAAPAPAGNLAGMIKQYIKIVIAVIAVIGLIVGIMNIFGMYDVTATSSYNGNKSSESAKLADLRDGSAPDDVVLYMLSSWVMGLVGLGTAGLAGYSLFLLMKNAPGSRKFFSLAALVGTVGTVAAILMALLGGSYKVTFFVTVTVRLGVPFIYWVALIFFGAALALDRVVLKDDCAPLQ